MKHKSSLLAILISATFSGLVSAEYNSAMTEIDVMYPELQGKSVNMVTTKDVILPENLETLSYELIETSEITRNEQDGYNNNNITATFENDFLYIKNETPRKLAEIVITDGVNGYIINQELTGFSTLKIKLSANINQDVTLLDPNSQSRLTPASFGPNTTSDDVYSFMLLNNHIKSFYGDKYQRDNFWNMFEGIGAKPEEILNKWHTTISYSTPKRYLKDQGTTPGSASIGGDWFSINGPIYEFNNNKKYTYIYIVYTHENAHTQGYYHGSGLAYGWDDYVGNGIQRMFNNGAIIPGEIVEESADIYTYYSQANRSLVFFKKADNDTTIESVDIISNAEKLNNLASNGNRIYFDYNISGLNSRSTIVTVKTTDSDRLNTYIVDTLSKEQNHSNRDPYYLYLNENGEDVFDVTRNIYWYIPMQDSVVSTDVLRGPSMSIWHFGTGFNTVVVNVTNQNNGQNYPVTLIAKRGGNYSISNGAISSRQLNFDLADNAMDDLPSGVYKGDFELITAGWHTSAYRKPLTVKIDFSIGADDQKLKLDSWSEDYTVSASNPSRMYFNFPDQDDLVSSSGDNEFNAISVALEKKITARLEAVRLLSDDEENIVIENDKRWVKYNGSLYELNDESYPLMPFPKSFFDETDFRNMFDFIDNNWELTWNEGGMTVVNKQFGNYVYGNGCLLEYVPSGALTDGQLKRVKLETASCATNNGSPSNKSTATGKTKITARVVGDDKIIYPIVLMGTRKIGNETGSLEALINGATGVINFVVDENSEEYKSLPNGQHYRTQLELNALNVDDSAYKQVVDLKVEFDKTSN